mmetsp:Transcript_2077/g.3314  ORF Transcript_2077/g.3314 Transcript_2077/m.3314 type:complete len:87 (-) Transcript_2077:347-607(-)
MMKQLLTKISFLSRGRIRKQVSEEFVPGEKKEVPILQNQYVVIKKTQSTDTQLANSCVPKYCYNSIYSYTAHVQTTVGRNATYHTE